MILHSHSVTHLLATLWRPSFHCREKLKTTTSTHVSFPSFPFVPSSSTLDCVYLSSLRLLPPTLPVIGRVTMGHDRRWDEAPTICHSSHPTTDSCLYPLTHHLCISQGRQCVAWNGVISIRRILRRRLKNVCLCIRHLVQTH